MFGTRKLESLGYRIWRCLRDPWFSYLSRTPTCDRQIDR